MTNRKSIWLSAIATILLVASITTSCNKKFDEPPAYIDPSSTINTSIRALKAMHASLGSVEVIKTNIIIGGSVVCDDKSGNYYKQIAIQDSTGGILLSLDAYNLYTSYPVGRKLIINVTGLALSDYGGVIQLGAVDNSSGTPTAVRIPSSLFDNYIQKGSDSNFIAPRKVTIGQIGTSIQDTLQSTLIQIDNAEVAKADTNKNYYTTSAFGNITINTCNGQNIILRSSSYASFAGLPMPNGNGSITGISSIYISGGKATKQLVIRDSSDLQFYGTRCGGSVTPTPTPTTNIITIADLRKMYAGADITLKSTQITGIVISDATSGNMSAGNMVIQDATAGIDLYFGSAAATSNFKIGDSVLVDITGAKLTSYNGLIEVSGSASLLPKAALAKGIVVTPKILNAAQFKTQMAATPSIECTLVTIQNATVPASTYSASTSGLVLTDVSGTTILYTSKNATFGTTATVTSPMSYTGYGTNFKGTAQLSIRNLNDVK